MRKKLILFIPGLIVLLIVAVVSVGKQPLPPIEVKGLGVPAMITNSGTSAFRGGEKITLTVKYMGFIPAGRMVLKVKEIRYRGRETYYLIAEGKSSSFFSLFRKVRSVLESYMDAEELYSQRFEEHTRVTGHSRDERLTTYDQKKGVALVSEEGEEGNRKVRIGANSQDFLSIIYYLRTRELKSGNIFLINLNERKKNFEVRAEVLSREEVAVGFRGGKFLAYPVRLEAKRVGKKDSAPLDFTIWFSDDKRKIPLLIKAKTRIGPVKAYLVETKL